MDKYGMLNDRQKEAVFCTEGPLLILAGAGSGKTKVLTHRIAYLIEEKGVAPYNIMAITFTNKAAEEMKNRVEKLVEYGDSVWVATFHSTCVRILRRFIDRLDYDPDFTIYDADDQRTVVRNVVKEMNLDPKMYKERPLVAYISDCKTNMISPSEAIAMGDTLLAQKYAQIYDAYEKRLRSNNALDFDDLLLKTVELLKKNADVLEYYQKKFRYIMVDEYQDTNHIQFEFISLLAATHKNLAVVGDDDQSIYRFRGADIRNILDFEDSYPGATVVKLEQNYRSTTHILDVANAVIRHNKGRRAKHLWSALGEGTDVLFRNYESGNQEADKIIASIRRQVEKGEAEYRDFAILYRTNAQSRLFEEKCMFQNVPYILVGGVNFYQREEVKDILAYLKTIATGRDNVSTERIINKPKRGIGDTTVRRAVNYADEIGESLFQVTAHPTDIPGINGAAAAKLRGFYELICELRAVAGVSGDPDDRMGFGDLIREILDRVEYDTVLSEYEKDRRDQKEENLQELISKAKSFEDDWDEENPPTLVNFLEEVALVADIDAMDDDDNKVVLMTLHGSKGLEFPHVYLTGMEEGMFPSFMAISDEDPMAIEEERRLAYVGITRAMKSLHLSAARMRMVNGETRMNKISRFVEEIPPELVTNETDRSFGFGRDFTGSFGTKGFSGNKFGNPSFGRPVNSGYFNDFEKREAVRIPEPIVHASATQVKKADHLDYTVGDRVRHMRFGEGTVLDIADGKKDYEVTVAFDTAGEKRMLAGFAKLTKI